MDTGILAMFAMASVLCNANDYHHLTVGPEACIIYEQDRHLGSGHRKNMWMAGANISYEYLEPVNFYFGAEAKYMVGSMTVSDMFYYPVKRYELERQFDTVHKSLEARVGFNFLGYRDFMITPYIGAGDKYTRAISSDKDLRMRMSRETLYVVHGVRAEYIFSKSVHFGVNFRQYAPMRGSSRSSVVPSYLNPLAGGHEISFPWAFKLHGNEESFVLKFEPYFRKDNVNSTELTIGSTLQISCDF